MSEATPSPAQGVGPIYRPDGEKPTATVSKDISYENVHVLPQSPQLIALLTMIRDRRTSRADFIFYSNRIIRLLVEEGLNHLPVVEQSVTTPVGRVYLGVRFEGKICGVSIMRAGEAMEQGGSATLAVEVLKAKGVPEDRILFLNLIASPSGVADFAERFPKLRVVTAFIDQGLDDKKYIIPGLGDFGDRYYTL
ncbi:cytosine deaminase-uracil phosphoribosyltransferase fusion protein [Aspergillus luchuensis IFO 4308]|uniref:Cytosine deaminase-uracil phosphoribosyltransferase fusion protein n=1 Tax=Aspergillus niger TaxID=5061 RepID=A0A100IQ64_ASPNG|nr:cytosine deaminase-uracil phosphoribosyltransferase fusion protein [Aspergillus luchuensis IFO 4308]GAQ45327.1 cytosine deaminase-uracil phosphoribosyltransferase fusion protein [Aspergillus niger]